MKEHLTQKVKDMDLAKDLIKTEANTKENIRMTCLTGLEYLSGKMGNHMTENGKLVFLKEKASKSFQMEPFMMGFGKMECLTEKDGAVIQMDRSTKECGKTGSQTEKAQKDF